MTKDPVAMVLVREHALRRAFWSSYFVRAPLVAMRLLSEHALKEKSCSPTCRRTCIKSHLTSVRLAEGSCCDGTVSFGNGPQEMSIQPKK